MDLVFGTRVSVRQINKIGIVFQRGITLKSKEIVLYISKNVSMCGDTLNQTNILFCKKINFTHFVPKVTNQLVTLKLNFFTLFRSIIHLFKSTEISTALLHYLYMLLLFHSILLIFFDKNWGG